jgi:heat shock protein HslJ
MPEHPTIPDDAALVAQLRAWADDLAEQVGPVAAPTRAPRHRPRALAVAAALLVVLGLAAAVVATRSEGGDEDVRTGTTTTPSTTEPTTTVAPGPPDLPLLETTWWLERVEVDGEEPVVAPDRSLTMFLTEDEMCASPDDCPRPDAFLRGSDGCNGYWATVTLAEGRFTARPFGARTTVACDTPASRVGDLVAPIEDGTSTYEIDGATLVLRFGERTTFRFRAEPDPDAPVPPGHSVFVDREGEPTHRWSWGEGIDMGEASVLVSIRASVERRDNGARARLPADAPPGSIAAALNVDPPLVFGLVDARATTVAYTRGDTVRELTTRALEGRPDLRVFSGGVPDAQGGWRVTAIAADGTVVATFEAGP